MHNHKILDIAPPNISLQKVIAQDLGVSRILAQVLINRGVTNTKEAEEFLRAEFDSLLDPYLFPDMPKAVSLIRDARAKQKKVLIFGDYDVDGVTALAILKSTLARIGIDAIHYIPHRIKEGYGLNKNILHIAKSNNVKLLITVDCGTNSDEEIGHLRKQGVEVIVTDHHEPEDRLDCPASAIINPKIKNSSYKFRDLAGVGVAYKLCQAVSADQLIEDLDLVSLGTVADVVPLIGENRVIVKEGLSRISRTKKMGLKALIEASRINGRKMNTTFLSYILSPRINAGGRMDTAEVSLNLLMSKDPEEARDLAKTLENHNRQRQKIESKILEEAQDMIDSQINFKEHRVIVMARDGWHQGVLGIVASKLSDRFYRPTILISLNEGLCKGSGRSIKNFHLFQALLECKHLLEAFGGHSHAVGLLISKDKVEEFRKSINLIAHNKLHFQDLIPSIGIDMELTFSDLNDKVIMGLEALEPFGTANPEPLFYTRNLKLKGTPLSLARDTLKFWVSDGDVTYQAIGFGMSSLQESLSSAASFDLVYTPRMDSWDGKESVILEIKDIFLK